MLHKEMIQVTDEAANRMGAMLGLSRESMLADALRQNLQLLVGAIDRVTAATNRPTLITSFLPGYDMVVARPEVTHHKDMVPTGAEAVLAVAPIDPKLLETLTLILDEEFVGAIKGALVYDSEDGTTYVVFQSSRRAEALASMGIYVEDVIDLPAAGAVQ